LAALFASVLRAVRVVLETAILLALITIKGNKKAIMASSLIEIKFLQIYAIEKVQKKIKGTQKVCIVFI
jgi:hypothetical protein